MLLVLLVGPILAYMGFGALALQEGGRQAMRQYSNRMDALVQQLYADAGPVRTRQQLLDNVWGYTFASDMGTVTVHIRRLREKLPVLNEAIETVKQFGYKLTA